MNYPVWDIPWLGSGLVVAMIATFHVLISHFAVGGGAFLFLAEYWAGKDPQGRQIRNWLHSYATFFLIVTTVLGAVTGVGIWFAIQLAGPEATSLLIHQFVYVWATEWVAFLGELTVLYYYYYAWKRNSEKMQLFLAGAYFVIAWLSLVAINGILSFMLTPGGWTLENKDIFAAFFNETYWPSLVIRTLFMFVIGGLFACAVASRIKDLDFKERIISFSVKWVIPAAVLVPFFAVWFWLAIPESSVKLVMDGMVGLSGGRLEIISRYLLLALASSALVLIGAAVMAYKPRAVTTLGASSLILVMFLAIAGGEFFREMARKPYVVYGVLYSNSLWKHQVEDKEFMSKPYLENTKWDPEVESLSKAHGEWIFRLQCASCHTRHGYRALADRTEAWTPSFGMRWLGTMDEGHVMPPFAGDERDKAALTAYLLSLSDNEAPDALAIYEEYLSSKEAKTSESEEEVADE